MRNSCGGGAAEVCMARGGSSEKLGELSFTYIKVNIQYCTTSYTLQAHRNDAVKWTDLRETTDILVNSGITVF